MATSESMFITSRGRPGINWRHPWIKLMGVAGVGLIVLIIILVVAIPRNSNGQYNVNAGDVRHDCTPDVPFNQTDKDKCSKRGCAFDDNPPAGQPHCYFPDDFVSYEVEQITPQKLREEANCHPHAWTIKLKKNSQPSTWPNDVKDLVATVAIVDDSRVRVTIADEKGVRWRVPEPNIDAVVGRIQSSSRSCDSNPQYSVDVSAKGEVKITRKSTGAVIFSTDLRKLIFADQFIEVRVEMSNNVTYGLSEHLDRFAKKANSSKRYTIFNTGDPILPNQPLYGSHPFALTYEPAANGSVDGDANGIMLFSSNGMELVFSEDRVMTYRVIGGILDFFIFTGPSSFDVLKQKAELIGMPFMPPFWSLGFHICRYGYKNTQHIKDVYERTRAANIPFDTQWADIDYMNRGNMFTLNKSFEDLPNFVKLVHSQGLHFIPILDPPVSASEPEGTYEPLDEGNALDIFIKDPADPTKPWRGKVWNFESDQGDRNSIFPDFTNPKTTDWWIKHLTKFHDVLEFDGLWIDMNEPTTFWPEKEGDCPKDLTYSNYDYPPYRLSQRDPIFNQTMCLQAKHHLGSHYDLHNLFAFYESKMTFQALERIRGKRPFIISRATTTGQGVYGGHWNGDIHSSWEHLKMSVPTLLDFGLYAMPMVGADVCGFFDDAEEKMCIRWQQLGAFYPFVRNHNDIHKKDQDPAFMSDKVAESARSSLEFRYTLLPYLYTLFWKAHKTGSPVMTPLVLNFPEQLQTHDIDTQFMWGSGLMLTPILDPDTDKTEVYFPDGIWYDYTKKEFRIKGVDGNTWANVTFAENEQGIYVRGGTILPFQQPKSKTSEQITAPLRLLIAPDQDERASGELYWDDGDTIDPVKYTHAKITYESGKLDFTPIYNLHHSAIDEIVILHKDEEKSQPINNCTVTASEKIKCEVISTRPITAVAALDITKPWTIEFFHTEPVATPSPPATEAPEVTTKATVEPTKETPATEATTKVASEPAGETTVTEATTKATVEPTKETPATESTTKISSEATEETTVTEATTKVASEPTKETPATESTTKISSEATEETTVTEGTTKLSSEPAEETPAPGDDSGSGESNA